MAVKPLVRRHEAFFDNISAAKDNFQFSIRIYFDALDHLSDDGIVILKFILFPGFDDLLDLFEPVIRRTVRIRRLLNSIDSVFEQCNCVRNLFEFVFVTLNIFSILNTIIDQFKHFPIQRINFSLEQVHLVRAAI